MIRYLKQQGTILSDMIQSTEKKAKAPKSRGRFRFISLIILEDECVLIKVKKILY